MATLGGRYRLVERLGTGGMSVVWRAFDEVLGRQVAVKVLDGELAANPEFRRAIRREARAVARLAHPNIGVVYDYGERPDASGVAAPYVVMELIDGQTLGERLRTGTLPWPFAVGVCAQIAAALAAAHARGLVHRDVKPANVMLSSTGVKVVDFGISALVGEQTDRDGDGVVQGTAGYVAPERLNGAPVGAAADVYAVGVVLFKTLTGRLPWPAADEAEILAAHLSEPPDPLPPIDGLPGEVNDLYRRCLAKNPGQRPDAREMAGALGRLSGPASLGDLVAEDTAAGREDREPTTLLPSATDTAPLKTGGAPVPERDAGTSPLRPYHRRRIAALALVPLALVVGALYLTTTGDQQSQATSALGASEPSCAVTYRLGTDDGTRFTGTLTFRAWQSMPAGGWAISFDLPARQTFQAAAPATSAQDGEHVVVRLAGSPTPDDAGHIVVPFTGSYDDVNPLPAQFVANGRSCTSLLLGPNGTPPPAPATGPANANSPAPANGPAAANGPTPANGPGPRDAPTPANGPGPATQTPDQPHEPPGHATGADGKPGKGKGR